MSTVIVTANRLVDGLVVFRTTQGSWSSSFSDAALYDDAAPILAAAAGEATVVVGPYAVEVEQAEDGASWQPLTTREKIRIQGPSIDFKRSA